MRRSRVAFALGVVVPLLVLGGCSDDDPEVKVAPSGSSSPTPTPTESSSPTEPGLSPEATVRAWIDAQNRALQTGDLRALKDLSADPCQACDDFIKPIERVYRDGGHFETKGWTVEAARTREKPHDPFIVDAGVSIAGGRTYLKAGAEPVIYEADKRIIVFKVSEQASRLVVSFIGFLS